MFIRKYSIKPLRVAVFIIILLMSTLVVGGPPVSFDIPPFFPGEIIGSASSRWIAPYVHIQKIAISDIHQETVTWYSRDGIALKQLSGSQLHIASSYVQERRADTTLYHAVCDTSTYILRSDSSFQDQYFGERDFGKYFWLQYTRNGGEYTDFYTSGKYIGTYGPHCRISGSTFNVSDSGGLAYTISDSAGDGYCRVVSIDPAGKQVFSFRVEGALLGMTPSPTGNLVVISHSADRFTNHNTNDYACYFSSGKIVRARLGPNARLKSWVPNTRKMIVSTSVGDKSAFGLIDWESGDVLWKVPDPLEYTPMINYDGFAISKDYVILSGLAIRESIAHGPIIPNEFRGTIMMLAAIDINRGELAAKWYEPTFSGKWAVRTGLPPMPREGGSLIWYQDELYHVTDINFSRIDLDDIRNLRNGWVEPRSSGNVYHDVIH